MSVPRPRIDVDLDAIRHNVRLLRATAAVPLMVVVKADGYGHGMTAVARAARESGADWIAVASPAEALRLREAGDDGPMLCWLNMPGEDLSAVVAAGVEVTAYSPADLDSIADSVTTAHKPALVQLKVDTGLMRGGAAREEWQALFDTAAQGQADGRWQVTGIWSHFACADDPSHPANDAQESAFNEAVALATAAGLGPLLRHLANSAATLTRPSAIFDAVRCGIASYGLDPAPGADHGADLHPAMTLRAPLVLTKHLRPGDAVSYGHTWRAESPTTVGLVPLGYGDGIPRNAGGAASVVVGGHVRPIIGRVCMDQFLVDLGPEPSVRAGDEVVLFGDSGSTAQDWAVATDTINYEIVTRIGGNADRIERHYLGETR